jgi:hypothetical protein
MADEKRSFDPELRPPAALSDNPQEDWGEPADEGAAYSANHALRGAKSDAERSQGAKTRKATKDAISRRV